MTNTTLHTNTHRRRLADLARITVHTPRGLCFYCDGFPVVMTSLGVVICPVCYGSGIE